MSAQPLPIGASGMGIDDIKITLVERGSVDLSACYDIECYARADGYTQSETAKATLYWLNAEGGDDTDNINLVKTRGVMVTMDNNITIS